MSEVLSSQQIDCLQAVDVRLALVAHGRGPRQSDNLGYWHGPAAIGVHDSDYATVEKVHVDLQPGDVSARERIFGSTLYDYPESTDAVLSRLYSLLYMSPYAKRNPLGELSLYHDLAESYALGNTSPLDPCAILEKPELARAVGESLAICRGLQLDTPLVYADGLALLRGAHRAIADSSARTKDAVSVDQRNEDMVKSLGDRAIKMAAEPNPEDRRRTLAFTAGKGHKGIHDILSSYDIPFTSHVSRHPLGLVVRKEVALWAQSPTRVDELEVATWLKNARAYAKKHNTE